jgi:hypothetical protein
MFETKNEAALSIEKGRKENVYKDCTHLKIVGGPTDFDFYPYHAYCEQHSLIAFSERGFLERCPENCLLFVDAKALAKARIAAERKQARVRVVKAVLGTPFVWFAKLPAITQALIVFLLIVLFSPALAKSVIEIIKALK